MAKNAKPYRAGGYKERPASGRKHPTQEYAAGEGYDEYDDEYDDEYYDDDYDYQYYDDDLSRRRANRGCLIAFLAVLAAIIIAVLVAVFWVKGEIDGNRATATEPVIIDLNTSSGRTIGEMLENEGLISNSNIFRFYVRLNGSASGFQKGRFTITPGMSYDEIIETFSTEPPPRETVSVTFPEGSTVQQFASRLEEANVCTAAEFVEAANRIAAEEAAKDGMSEIEFFNHLDYDPETFMAAEGYLSANTIDFYTDEENSADYAARRLFQQLDAELLAISETIYEDIAARGMSFREFMTLSSLVIEEAGVPPTEEDPGNQALVAGVFWNRMRGDLAYTDLARRTMGSDVTYRYIQDWIAPTYEGGTPENVLEQNPGLYYAYYTGDDSASDREGLPAGPISNPGASAMRAALAPAEHNYFYFITDKYGGYHYATYFWEHQNNIALVNQINAQYDLENPDG